MYKKYYKKPRNNNKKTAILIIVSCISVFIITMIFYSQISIQANQISKSISESTKNYISSVNTSDDPRVIAMQLHNLVNSERHSVGLSNLSWDQGLADVATSHSSDMLTNNYFSHTDLQGHNPDYRINTVKTDCYESRENIAWTRGYYGSNIALKVIGDWMNSMEHRSNILSSSIMEGIGISIDGNYAIVTEDIC